MAKYTVTHTCGHTEDVQLFGAEKERARRLSGMRNRLCATCEAEQAAESAKASGLIPLTGSDKQIAWGNQIRAERLPQMRKAAETAEAEMTAMRTNMDNEELVAQIMEKKNMTREEFLRIVDSQLKVRQQIVDKYVTAVGQASAIWWIENR